MHCEKRGTTPVTITVCTVSLEGGHISSALHSYKVSPWGGVSFVGPFGSQGAYGASGSIPLVNPKVPSAMSMDSSAVYCTDVHVTGQQLHPSVMLQCGIVQGV